MLKPQGTVTAPATNILYYARRSNGDPTAFTYLKNVSLRLLVSGETFYMPSYVNGELVLVPQGTVMALDTNILSCARSPYGDPTALTYSKMCHIVDWFEVTHLTRHLTLMVGS